MPVGAGPAGARLVERAREMGPLILAHRDRTERDRRPAPEIVAALIDARLCRWGLPPELQGLEAGPLEWLAALEVLAGFEASVPWIAWNNSLTCLLSRFLAPSERAALFADPSWLYAQSTRPEGVAAQAGDDFRVSGRWSLVSGCELAEWLLLNCVIERNGEMCIGPDGAPETRLLFVHARDVRILDTWHVGGLRGSGSHDVVVEDVRVPASRSVSPEDEVTLEGALGRVPIIANLASDYASQTLGMAQRALDTLTELARTRVTPGPVPDLRDRPAAQAGIALHAAAVDAARSHLHRCAAALWERAETGAEPLSGIADAMAASGHAVSVSRRCVEDMFAAAGTSALYTDSPLERAHRDLHAMLRHVVAQPIWAEDAGRVRFGLPPAQPLFPV